MLTINDKVYLHIGDLSSSIAKVGFNKTRLCKIIDIKKGSTASNEEVGIYTLQAIYDDKTYYVMSNDKLWHMSDVSHLVETIKASAYDTDTIAKIIEVIFNS